VFLSDAALRAIAAATGDVWPEHAWRYDTADGDWSGETAQRLHRFALGFNDNSRLLQRALQRLHDDTGAALASLHTYAAVRRPHGIDAAIINVVALLERNVVLETMLLDAYASWRAHRPRTTDAAEWHLLVQPGNPGFGVATLRRLDGEPTTWLVIPDTVAAEAFAIPYAHSHVGAVTATDGRWQPVAFTGSDHPHALRHSAQGLPDNEQASGACRTLLRWCQLRHSPTWDNRPPGELTSKELAILTA
jgi:hypothetical protein